MIAVGSSRRSAGPVQNLLDDPAGVGREQAPQPPALAAVGPHAEHHRPGGADQQRGERIAVVEHGPGVERELRRQRPHAEDRPGRPAQAPSVPRRHARERHEQGEHHDQEHRDDPGGAAQREAGQRRGDRVRLHFRPRHRAARRGAVQVLQHRRGGADTTTLPRTAARIEWPSQHLRERQVADRARRPAEVDPAAVHLCFDRACVRSSLRVDGGRDRGQAVDLGERVAQHAVRSRGAGPRPRPGRRCWRGWRCRRAPAVSPEGEINEVANTTGAACRAASNSASSAASVVGRSKEMS